MARRATIGAMKNRPAAKMRERIGASRPVFPGSAHGPGGLKKPASPDQRVLVGWALAEALARRAVRATKVNEDRAGMGRFSPPLRVFFNRAVEGSNTSEPPDRLSARGCVGDLGRIGPSSGLAPLP